MNKFVIIARNINNGNCVVMTEIKAGTRKEAQQIATRDYYKYLEPGEQIVVANDRQWNEIWKDKVEATNALTMEGKDVIMKLNMKEELPKNEQGAAFISTDITKTVDAMCRLADAVKYYSEQMKNWTDNTYISDREYKAMQYNIRRVKGLVDLLENNANKLGNDFDV